MLAKHDLRVSRIKHSCSAGRPLLRSTAHRPRPSARSAAAGANEARTVLVTFTDEGASTTAAVGEDLLDVSSSPGAPSLCPALAAAR